ncbi:hypothetical protein D3C75_568500 [compost metagenome]
MTSGRSELCTVGKGVKVSSWINSSIYPPSRIPSTSMRFNRSCTSSTNFWFAIPLIYMTATSVLVTRPICFVSSHRFGSLILRRIKAVFVPSVSENPSRGPRTTFSEAGSVTPRSFHPPALTTIPFVSPSIRMIASPDNSALYKVSKSVISRMSPMVRA